MKEEGNLSRTSSNCPKFPFNISHSISKKRDKKNYSINTNKRWQKRNYTSRTWIAASTASTHPPELYIKHDVFSYWTGNICSFFVESGKTSEEYRLSEWRKKKIRPCGEPKRPLNKRVSWRSGGPSRSTARGNRRRRALPQRI